MAVQLGSGLKALVPAVGAAVFQHNLYYTAKIIA